MEVVSPCQYKTIFKLNFNHNLLSAHLCGNRSDLIMDVQVGRMEYHNHLLSESHFFLSAPHRFFFLITFCESFSSKVSVKISAEAVSSLRSEWLNFVHITLDFATKRLATLDFETSL